MNTPEPRHEFTPDPLPAIEYGLPPWLHAAMEEWDLDHCLQLIWERYGWFDLFEAARHADIGHVGTALALEVYASPYALEDHRPVSRHPGAQITSLSRLAPELGARMAEELGCVFQTCLDRDNGFIRMHMWPTHIQIEPEAWLVKPA